MRFERMENWSERWVAWHYDGEGECPSANDLYLAIDEAEIESGKQRNWAYDEGRNDGYGEGYQDGFTEGVRQYGEKEG